MKKIYILPLLLLFIGIAAVARTETTDRDMLRKKARYYYMEGVKMAAEDKSSEAVDYFRKAYLIDTTYSEAANSYGTLRFWMYTDTLQTPAERAKSLAMMGKFVEEYPADMTEALVYAYATDMTDTLSTKSLKIYERLDSLYPSDTRLLLKLAEGYDKAGRFDDAIAVLTRLEGKNGKNEQLTTSKISLMLQKGDTIQALQEADDLVASNPREPVYRILKGNLYEVLGENDSTLAYYQQAERLNPELGAAKLSLAEFYKMNGDSVAYDNKIYEALLTEDFGMEEKLMILGQYLQTLITEKNNTERGDHLFNVLMEQYPHEAEMIELAARFSAAKSDFGGAAQYMSYAVDQAPDNTGYWAMLMRFLVLDDKPREAMAAYEKMQGILPEIAKDDADDMLLLYAAAAAAAKDYDTAEQTYAEMIHNISPSLPLIEPITDKEALSTLTYDNLVVLANLYQMLGDTYYQEKKIEETFKAYDNSLFFLPDNPLTLNNYAYFLTETGGDIDKAFDYSSKAIQASGDNPTFLDTYAWVLFKKKEYDKALEFQQKAIEIAEQNGEELSAEYFHHLGDILFMNHKPEEALENWKKALKLEPENSLLKKKVDHKTFFFE